MVCVRYTNVAMVLLVCASSRAEVSGETFRTLTGRWPVPMGFGQSYVLMNIGASMMLGLLSSWRFDGFKTTFKDDNERQRYQSKCNRVLRAEAIRGGTMCFLSRYVSRSLQAKQTCSGIATRTLVVPFILYAGILGLAGTDVLAHTLDERLDGNNVFGTGIKMSGEGQRSFLVFSRTIGTAVVLHLTTIALTDTYCWAGKVTPIG